MSLFNITVTRVSLMSGDCKHPHQKDFSSTLLMVGKAEFTDRNASESQCHQLSAIETLIEFEVLKPKQKPGWKDADQLGQILYFVPSNPKEGLLSILVACQESYFNHLCEAIIKPYLQNTRLELVGFFECTGFKYDNKRSKINDDHFNAFMKGFMVAAIREGRPLKNNALQITKMSFSLLHNKDNF